MAGLRAQLGWFLRGRAQTLAALDSLTTDLRALQAKVADLEHRVERDRAADVDALRVALAGVTDDLTDRLDALRSQVQAVAR